MSKNYKKLTRILSIFIILSSFIGISAKAQIFIPDPLYGQIHHRGAFDSTLYSPTYHGVPTDSTFLFSHGVTGHGQILKQAAFYYDSVGHTLYVWDPSLKSWQTAGTVSGSTFDSTSLSNRINQRLPYIDTASMLAPYLQTALAIATFYPLTSNPANYIVSGYLSNVLNSPQVINAGGALSWATGLYSARPAPGTYGRHYTATDSAKLYFDNGGGWITIGGSGGVGGSSTFAGLSDVTLTLPSGGQLIKRSGTQWINFSPAAADVNGWLGYTPENVANKSTVGTLGISDVLYPTQHAVKIYVDNSITGFVPALTVNQIAFGSPSNLMTSSADFMANLNHKVSFGQSNVYSVSGGFPNNTSATVIGNGNIIKDNNTKTTIVGDNNIVQDNTGSGTANVMLGSTNILGITGNIHQVNYSTIGGFQNQIVRDNANTVFGFNNQILGGSQNFESGSTNKIDIKSGSTLFPISSFVSGQNLVLRNFGTSEVLLGTYNDTSRTSLVFAIGNGVNSSSLADLTDLDSLGNWFVVPRSTANRPASPRAGTWGINSDSAFRIEVFDGSVWHATGSGSGGGGGSVTAVNGTTNRITSSGGSSPAIDISATFEALLSKKANTIDVNNASSTSAQIASLISDETGTGKLAFATSGVFTTPRLNSTSAIGQVWAANDINGNAAFTSLTNAMLAFSFIKFGTTNISLGATTSPFVSGFLQINDTMFVDTKIGGVADTFRFTGLGINDTTYYLGGVNISGPSNHDTVTLGGTFNKNTHESGSNNFNFYLDSTILFLTGPNYSTALALDTSNYKLIVRKTSDGSTREMNWPVGGGGGLSSFTSPNGTITIGGTLSAPTVDVLHPNFRLSTTTSSSTTTFGLVLADAVDWISVNVTSNTTAFQLVSSDGSTLIPSQSLSAGVHIFSVTYVAQGSITLTASGITSSTSIVIKGTK